MKTAIVVYQDAADDVQEALDGRTLLQSARARAATGLACRGCGGWVPSPVYAHCILAQACGLPIEQASLLRRGPVEARLLEHPPGEGDQVYRVDLVAEDHGVICSIPTPGTEETRELTAALNHGLGDRNLRFDCLERGALILMLSGVGDALPEGLPTEQALGRDRLDTMPTGRGAAHLREIMIEAGKILVRHPVNEIRVDLGEDPANGIWMHGGGRWPDTAEASAAVESTVMLTESLVGRGMARMLNQPSVPLQRTESDDGPWFHVPDLVSALQQYDSLVVDVVLGKAGGPVERVRELDRIDQQVLAPLLDILSAHRPYRIVLMAAAPESVGGVDPQDAPLPLVVSGDDLLPDSVLRWDESACTDGILGRIDLATFVRELRDGI